MASSVVLNIFVLIFVAISLRASNARHVYGENDVDWSIDSKYYSDNPAHQYSKGTSNREKAQTTGDDMEKESTDDMSVGQTPNGYRDDITEPLTGSAWHQNKPVNKGLPIVNRTNRAADGTLGNAAWSSMEQHDKLTQFYSKIPAFLILPRSY